jgi:hypothetical protein
MVETASIQPDRESPAARPVRLRDIALATIADVCGAQELAQFTQGEYLRTVAALVHAAGRSPAAAFDACVRAPAGDDVRIVWIAAKLQLSRQEILAVALAASVEDDPLVGRVLTHVQAPVGGSRPTLGLLNRMFGALWDAEASGLPALLNGTALTSGLLTLSDENLPLPERQIAVPSALCLAIAGYDSAWTGAAIGVDTAARVPLSDSAIDGARQQAAALRGDSRRILVVRTGSPSEGRSVAAVIAAELNRRPLFVETDRIAALGPWVQLRRLLPVFCYEVAPGERRRVPAMPGYDGPIVALCGPDGAIDAADGAAASWTLQVPDAPSRARLWRSALGKGSEQLAEHLAGEHRHGAGRIAHLGRLARHYASVAGHASLTHDDIATAAWTAEGSGLDALAEPLRDRVPDEALVASPDLRGDLRLLIDRCRARESLTQDLGVSASTRYRPGVRALFTGSSGTGKTLAAGWIATQLGLPLYRVDLASVTSKYIGETEKNLSQLLARAEQAEVILLFDEADSLFGKRTDITDSNDRFANAQTNYLLQRIENYDGIVLLTSNSQARFDEAFSRRLDFIIEFPPPGPQERRDLWRSHLGPGTALTLAELNRLAALLDLNGGQTRNAVLAAAVRARHAGQPIAFADLVTSIAAELRKLGRQMPRDLQR